jgi:excisionase family DNA binding protein
LSVYNTPVSDRDFYTTAEFARLQGLSRSTVTRLVDAGRIPARRAGSHRRIFKEDLQAAGMSAPGAGIRGTLRREEIVRLAPEIRAVAARHGASNPRLFGSVARDSADQVSDVDILVDLDPGGSLLDLAQLELALEALLGRRVDVGTARSLRPEARGAALAEAVPL